jgi:hypothetical protein
MSTLVQKCGFLEGRPGAATFPCSLLINTVKLDVGAESALAADSGEPRTHSSGLC